MKKNFMSGSLSEPEQNCFGHCLKIFWRKSKNCVLHDQVGFFRDIFWNFFQTNVKLSEILQGHLHKFFAGLPKQHSTAQEQPLDGEKIFWKTCETFDHFGSLSDNFQQLSEKLSLGLSKNFLRNHNGALKKVLKKIFHFSLIFGLWENNFGFALKILVMLVKTFFYMNLARQVLSEKKLIFFNFGIWAKHFSKWAEKNCIVVKVPFYKSRGTF